jgi:hypothetical protein
VVPAACLAGSVVSRYFGDEIKDFGSARVVLVLARCFREKCKFFSTSAARAVGFSRRMLHKNNPGSCFAECGFIPCRATDVWLGD